MRKSTDPGGYEASETPTLGSVVQDDIPTQPESIPPETVTLVRLYGELSSTDKRRAVMLLTNWSRCTLDQRVLLEALSRELANGPIR